MIGSSQRISGVIDRAVAAPKGHPPQFLRLCSASAARRSSSGNVTGVSASSGHFSAAPKRIPDVGPAHEPPALLSAVGRENGNRPGQLGPAPGHLGTHGCVPASDLHRRKLTTSKSDPGPLETRSLTLRPGCWSLYAFPKPPGSTALCSHSRNPFDEAVASQATRPLQWVRERFGFRAGAVALISSR